MEPRAVIELDAFSGKRNPRWLVPRSAVDPILDLLKRLPRTDEPASPKALGPRGLRIFIEDDPAVQIYVVGSTISEVEPSGAQRIYLDESRQFLNRLIAVLRDVAAATDLELLQHL